jgi:hypothetical protein
MSGRGAGDIVKDELSLAARVLAMVPVARLLSERPDEFCKLGRDAVDAPALILLIVEDYRANPYCCGFLLGFVVHSLSSLGLSRDDIVREVDRVFETFRAIGSSSEVARRPS